MNWTGFLRNESYQVLMQTMARRERHGKTTLVRDLMFDLKRSAQALHSQLNNLESEGYIEMGGDVGQTRLPALTDKGREVARLMGAPVLGKVPAGLTRARSDCDGIGREGEQLFQETWDYLLPCDRLHSIFDVVGDSMIGDGIFEGARVYLRNVRGLHEVKPGQIAVVAVGEDFEETLKHVWCDDETRTVTLRASNPKYKDIVAAYEDVRVIGVKAAVIQIDEEEVFCK